MLLQSGISLLYSKTHNSYAILLRETAHSAFVASYPISRDHWEYWALIGLVIVQSKHVLLCEDPLGHAVEVAIDPEDVPLLTPI